MALNPHEAVKRPKPSLSVLYRRTLYVLIGVYIGYAALVATHLGEFWPFSIYQMFSSAGIPWKRALVIELPPDHPAYQRSQIVSEDRLPGVVFPLKDAEIEQNDLSAFVAQKNDWPQAHQDQLRSLFESPLASGKQLLFYRVVGQLAEDGSISVEYRPAIYLAPDTLITFLEDDLMAGGETWQP